jgi:GT2 family glycosyltransferase
MRRTLAAIVLSYGGVDQTRMAVASLRASRRPVDAIVVVDNGGVGADAVASPSPGAHVACLTPGTNVGFPAGVNLGLRRACTDGADLCLILNNDVVLAPDALGALEAALDAHPHAGIVGPLVLSRSKPWQVASRGIQVSIPWGRIRHLDFHEPFDDRLVTPWSEPTAVEGSAMLVTRATIDRVGWFDEEYFFGFEDVDYCLRARRAGIGVGLAGAAVAYHQGAAALNVADPRRFYFAARNHLRLAARQMPLSPAGAIARTLWLVALAGAHALRTPGGPRRARLSAVARGWRDHVRGRYGPG